MAKTKTIENLFTFLAWVSSLITPMLLLAKWDKFKHIHWVFILAIYGLVEHTAAWLNFLLPASQDPYVYPIFTFLEFGLFFYFLYTQIRSEAARRLGLIVAIAYEIFGITILLLKVEKFDSVSVGVEVILLILFSGVYLFEKINRMDMNSFIYNEPTFWAVLGIILPLAGSFFIMIYASQLSPQELKKVWMYVNLFSIIKYILLGIAMHLSASEKQTKTPERKPVLQPLT